MNRKKSTIKAGLPEIDKISLAAKDFFEISALKFKPLDLVLHESTKLLLSVITLAIVGGMNLELLAEQPYYFTSYVGFCFIFIGFILCFNSRNVISVVQDIKETKNHMKRNFTEYIMYRYDFHKSDVRLYEITRGIFSSKFNNIPFVCLRTFKVGLTLVGFGVIVSIMYPVIYCMESLNLTENVFIQDHYIYVIIFFVLIFVVIFKRHDRIVKLIRRWTGLEGMNEEIDEYLQIGERPRKTEKVDRQ